VGVMARKSYEVRATRALFEAMIRCMETALGEVASSGSRHQDMTKTIHVRVSDELHQIIREWAEIEGISIPSLIRREVEGGPLESDQIVLRARMRDRIYKGDIPDDVRVIREGRGTW
jgi:hypothetical protein